MLEWLNQAWIGISQFTVLYPLELTVLVSVILMMHIPECSAYWGMLQWRFHAIARRRRLAITIVFLFTLLGRFAWERNLSGPPPGVHDEFSYLLAADTFASGRITNPPHPMRFFFESFHILVQPTYMSMYPPGQGLMLALGILLTGKAIFGVWLSAALSASAVCWMLQGWTRPHWALLGGLLFAVRIGWFSYWANSYWGGCVAAMGGALLFGAIPRLVSRPRRAAAILMGAGILILENTRLWEGTVLSAIAVLWLLVQIFRKTPSSRVEWVRKVAPSLAGVLLLGAGGIIYYNYKITGSFLRLPYLENRAQYQIFGSFAWQQPQLDRQYSHEIFRRFYLENEGTRRQEGYLPVQLEKPKRLWIFFLGPALTVALFGLWNSWRSPRLQLAWIASGAFVASHLFVTWHLLPHYAAPVVACIYLLIMEGLRRLYVFRRKLPLRGQAVSRGALAACTVMVLFRIVTPNLEANVERERTLPWYSNGLFVNTSRQKIEERLTSMGGKHLILVEYSPGHPTHFEWVYNRADIDAANVVWARQDSSPEQLQELLNYYKDRHVWTINPDLNPSRISDYRRLQ